MTEAFVRNALDAANRELDGTFEQRLFAYEPNWDAANEWIDFGLRALQHTVSVRRSCRGPTAAVPYLCGLSATDP